MIRLKRAYEPPSADDGERILVERLWPRGLTKAAAKVDLWLKEVAPSAQLRTWYAHDVAKWPEFKQKYRAELKDHPDELALLRRKAKQGRITLVYAARDEEHNSARVLMEVLSRGAGDRAKAASSGRGAKAARAKKSAPAARAKKSQAAAKGRGATPAARRKKK